MNIIALQPIVILAGIINGSFALPTKYLKKWRFENIWLIYACIAFIILPLLFIWIDGAGTWSVYQHASSHLLWYMILGGFAFGIGQVCFAIALDSIGLGLGFLINIGLGTALGFSLPLAILHPSDLFSPFGLVTCAGTLLIIVGLVIAYIAGLTHDRASQQTGKRIAGYSTGIILAIVAGIFSATQNFTFAVTAPLQHAALALGLNQLSAATVVWPGFLMISFIPYALYMLYLLIKNRSFTHFTQGKLSTHLGAALIMAVCWYGSLMLYSYVSINIGALGPIVAWPLFMVLIILTSNFWGWYKGEWANAPTLAKRQVSTGILALLISFAVLAFSVTLSN